MMNLKKIIILCGLAAIFFLAIAYMAGLFTDKIEPGEVAVHYQGSMDDGIPAALKTVQLSEPFPASVEAKQATIISSRILSRIEKVHVRAGASVKKGQLLIKLDDNDLTSRLNQAKAQVMSAKARVVESKKALDRTQTLNKTGVLSDADLDKAIGNYDALKANYNEAKQGLNEAKAGIEFSKIYSPINGRIVDRFAEPGDTAQPGAQLLSIYNPVSLRIEASVREQLALALELEQELSVFIPSINQRLVAIIEEMVPAGNTGSRSFLIKARLDYSGKLLPGMYARVDIPAGQHSLVLIPNDRIALVGQLNVIWVLNDKQVERRIIRTGEIFDDGLTQVISGAQEGELILPLPDTLKQ